jgi:hypothetical protein
MPEMTDHDDRLPGEPQPPVIDLTMGSPTSAWDQARVRREIFVDADVNERRCVDRADESRKFFG